MLKQIYHKLEKAFSPQGWWPIISDKNLLCEYHRNAPCNDDEALEICIGAILAQNTQFYPNVVRALQQLKLGRKLTKQELEVLKEAEIQQERISGNKQKQTKHDILTQNTSWKNVEKAILKLSGANLISLTKLASAEESELAELIRSSGYHNQKAKKLKFFANHVLSKHKSIEKFFKQPNLREELLSLWGIGPETADSIVLYAAKQPSFVVDAYTKRIFSRLGFCSKDVDYHELQNRFHDKLPKDACMFNEYHALLVELAKRNCKAKPDCSACPLCNECKKSFSS